MTARTSMGTLIGYVRVLIGDTSGTASQKFTDDQVQSALDVYQEYVSHEQLTAVPTSTASGLTYKVYNSRKYFEGGGTILNGTFGTSTPDSVDYLNGRYEYTASTTPSIDRYIDGHRYDVFAAAADLAEQWIASIQTTAIDFRAGSSAFSQSQIIKNLMDMATRYRGMSERGGVNTILINRGDWQ